MLPEGFPFYQFAIPEVCMLPQETGRCRAAIPRFFFDYAAQDCKQFAYGGCDANANNFDSREACMNRCNSLLRDRSAGWWKFKFF